MGGQLHITHRAAYLRGVAQGKSDAKGGADYRPSIDVDRTDAERAYRIGYADGWVEALDADNG